MKLFGTDGIRGKANVIITPELSFRIGAFLGQFLKKNRILLARDTRISGPIILSSMASGILSSGGDVTSIDVAPTPALAYLVKKGSFDYGVMISASHNHFADNGIKIFDKNGFKISDDIEKEIEEYVLSSYVIPLNSGDKIGNFTFSADLLNEYIAYCKHEYNPQNTRVRLLVDAANGSAVSVLKRLFSAYDLDVTLINNEANGININENCGSTHIDRLQAIIKSNPQKYDLGVAFDGDADRVLFVGRNGDAYDGDYILYLFAKFYHKKGLLKDDKVVATVMANYGLKKALSKMNVDLVFTNVGDKYVQREMVKHGYLIGGEQSGHIIFNGFITTGDGIFTLMKVLHILDEENTTFDDYVHDFTKFPQVLINQKVCNKKVVMENPELIHLIDTLNTKLEGHGRVLVRPSGTEDLIRVMVEATSQEEAQNVAKDLLTYIK